MLPISKLPSIRPTCVVEMSKCLSICVIELFMCVAVRDLEKQAKDSTKMNIYKPQGGREASELHLRKSSISTYHKVTLNCCHHFKKNKGEDASVRAGVKMWKMDSDVRHVRVPKIDDLTSNRSCALMLTQVS